MTYFRPTCVSLFVWLGMAVSLGAQQGADAGPLAITGVTVVDVVEGRLVLNQTVVVHGTRITAVGGVSKVRVPAGARVVEGRGKYLIPGLWDMHVHPMCWVEPFYTLHIVNGVTGMRDAGSSAPLEATLQWRREVTAGTRVGPRHVLAGPYLEGKTITDDECGGQPFAVAVTTPDEAARMVDSLKRAGADLVKSHWVSRDVYFAIARASRRAKIPFAGHLPGAVSLMEASDSGAIAIDHWLPECLSDSARLEACAPIAERFRRNNTWLALGGSGAGGGWVQTWSRFWPASLSKAAGVADSTASTMLDSILLPATTDTSMLVIQRAGLPIVVGTDAASMLRVFGVPGYVVHHAMQSYVRGGLTPLEALRAATLNPAKMLRATDSLGSITAGKLADLVLLDADPLADIANARRIRAVIANGRYYDRAALDTMLTRLLNDMRSR